MANEGRRRLVLASRNRDKLREMRELCAGLPLEIVSALDYPDLPEVIEDGTTLLGNASRKAIVTAAHTGEIAVADDTALQVRALNNLPDVFASRFAGPGATYADNAALVIELMRDVPDAHRQARFVTAVAWVDPRPEGIATAAAAPGAAARWLHNPFARAIEVRDPAAASRYWDGLSSRGETWELYRQKIAAALVTHGAERRRLEQIAARLVAPLLGGGRPAGAPANAVQMPDTRLWTASGPAAPGDEAPTIVAPPGLPATAPGRAVNAPIWREWAAEGRVEGWITREPLGAGGFGYDPIFRPHESDRTLAELAPQEKNAVSHRGRALRRLLTAVAEIYGAAV